MQLVYERGAIRIRAPGAIQSSKVWQIVQFGAHPVEPGWPAEEAVDVERFEARIIATACQRSAAACIANAACRGQMTGAQRSIPRTRRGQQNSRRIGNQLRAWVAGRALGNEPDNRTRNEARNATNRMRSSSDLSSPQYHHRTATLDGRTNFPGPECTSISS